MLEGFSKTCLQLPDSSVVAGDNFTILAVLTNYYGTPSPSNLVRTNYGQGQVYKTVSQCIGIGCVLNVGWSLSNFVLRLCLSVWNQKPLRSQWHTQPLMIRPQPT